MANGARLVHRDAKRQRGNLAFCSDSLNLLDHFVPDLGGDAGAQVQPFDHRDIEAVRRLGILKADRKFEDEVENAEQTGGILGDEYGAATRALLGEPAYDALIPRLFRWWGSRDDAFARQPFHVACLREAKENLASCHGDSLPNGGEKRLHGANASRVKNRAGIASLALLLTACSGHARNDRVEALRGDGSRGRGVYLQRCAACHGADARGTRLGPDLHALSKSWSDKRIFGAIEEPEAPMPKLYPSQLSRRDLADVAAYIDGVAAEK